MEKVKFKIIPRLLDNIGLAMYSSIPKSISELVANCYDADASEVYIDVRQDESDEFISILTKENVKNLSDSKGRAYDNIIIERFWRTLKYENVYLIGHSTIKEARDGIGEYINFYNYKRPHASLGYKTPMSVYKTTIQEAA